MPENPLVVDTLIRDRREFAFLDIDGDGTPDGYHKLLLWTLHDLPYPDTPGTLEGFEALGNREREVIDKLAIIGTRAEVTVHRIRGHASAEGEVPDNEALALLRANAVHDAILQIRIDDPSLEVYLSTTVIVEGLGEFEPAVIAGNDDHPLNRRVEIEFQIGKIVPEPFDPNQPASNKWRIGFDQGLSFYMTLGAQIGFGTLERLDSNSGEPLQVPDKRNFWYYAGGVGFELTGKLSGKAAQARDKLASGQSLNRLEKAALMLDKRKQNLLSRINKLLPERAVQQSRQLWKETTDLFDTLGLDEQWQNKSTQQKTSAVFDALGIESLVSHTFVDGYFETVQPRRMSEMDLSTQLLFQIGIQGGIGVNGSFQITALLMYIFDPDNHQSGEWISATIAESALGASMIPSAGASISANIATFHFR